MQVSRSSMIFTAVLLFADLIAGGAATPKPTTPKPKNASGCTRRESAEATPGGCSFGPDACYDCEYTNLYGTYRCYEAPNPADATYCDTIDHQNYGSLEKPSALVPGRGATPPSAPSAPRTAAAAPAARAGRDRRR